jgi:lactaldehyde dehydrogenase
MVNEAIQAGARLRSGGKRQNAFMEPTVLTEVPVGVPLFKEECFGPVAPLVRFTSIDEAIRMANDSPYGLQSGIFTSDINKAIDIAYKLEAGGVIINWSSALRVETLPFGGIKMSGHGREGIHDTLDEMTDQKTIVVHNAFPPVEAE